MYPNAEGERPLRALTLPFDFQILKEISTLFPFFKGNYKGWRDSVRHNLSSYDCFVKVSVSEHWRGTVLSSRPRGALAEPSNQFQAHLAVRPASARRC